ncbi:MAG: hypothetical protein KAI79_19825, partial [Bacteroidales bacterium]|nr:hypothetical protein [Bacteroidales bacterium]
MIKHNTFTIKADKKYNYKFDYSKFTYVNAKVKSTIICPIHGEFQQNPDKHLSGKYGCLKCSNLQRKITLSKLPKQKRKVRSDWVVEKAY